MKRSLTQKALSVLLIAGMLLSSVTTIFAEDGQSPENDLTAGQNESVQNETATQSESDPDKDKDLIEHASSLANGTHTAYTNASRNVLNIKNKTMSLNYNLQTGSNMNVASFNNTQGTSYIQDTMDIFVKTDDGETYYSSKSTTSATMNIYRYGYYYYENRIEGQVFVPEIKAVSSKQITSSPREKHDISNVTSSDGTYSYTINGSDPYISFGNAPNSLTDYYSLKVDTSSYNYLELTVKATQADTSSQVFIMAGSDKTYDQARSYYFMMASDGEFHTYYIPLTLISGYTGTLKGIRLDINGAVGSQVVIQSIKFIKAQDVKLDSSLSIQRSFLSYSDKLHHLTQFSTYKEIDGIESVGMITKIAANTVNALVVKDASGLKYSLENVDWASAEYVGFDIAEAGIFGYILPADDKSGSLEVTNDGTNYIITQTLAVDKFTPSCNYDPEKDAQKGRYEAIAPENGNDIFFGQRIYNDETHDFAGFLYEAECERHHLTAENITVSANEDGAKFVGYDALRGYYQFAVNGTSFSPAYYDQPNRHYNVRFTVNGDEYDRQMYFMTRCSLSGCLETAVLLNDQDMLLPIPMEVAKNFGSDGENTIYNNQDKQYGEAYFPIIANAGESRTYTLVNLYQNWGQFPLKQISSIQFHQPYYHLSTGVTETNCIVIYTVNSPGLPDHRAMSAPFWTGQPQHNSAGGHSFLRYTDANGKTVSSQSTSVTIDSYGPTYADITMNYVTSDGRVSATYTHTEMPQIDENRGYYEMTYTFNDTVSFDDFRSDFIFYSMTDNNGTGVYQKLGYLDVNNQSQVVDAEHSKDSADAKTYVLGKDCPYFSFFMMPEWNRESTSAQGYANLSMLFKDWKVVTNGVESTPNLHITNYKETVYLSMDLGNVTFNKGDTITINAILMPWGSQQMEDDPANRLENAQTAIYDSPHYSDVLPDGSLYMDKNVRDVRENTLLNPLTTNAVENATVIDSPFVPKVRSTNRKSATFTVSGGYDNNTVRIYGFDKLTAPYIEELIDGEWVEYKVSSKSTPDAKGNGHSYDGYMAHYDEDGTYSYSFVFNMTDYESRTFRISADEDFEGWPFEISDVTDAEMNIVIDGKTLYESSSKAKPDYYSSKEYITEDGVGFVRLYIKSGIGESYSEAYSSGSAVGGRYIVYKYRIPTTNSRNIGFLQFWTSTERANAGGDDDISINANAVRHDGEWHVMVVDVTTLKDDGCTFAPDEYGQYIPRYLRVDTTNTDGPKMAEGDYVDVAYLGFSDSLAEIIAANQDVRYVDVINSDKQSYTSIPTANYTVPADSVVLSLESKNIDVQDSTFTLELKIENNKGFNLLRLIPKFDYDSFDLIKIENGDVRADMSRIDGALIWSTTDTTTDNGTIATFTFRAKQPFYAGQYSFDVLVVDAASTAAGEVVISTTAATVIADNPGLGDCDGDGDIDLEDLMLLRRYLADYDYDLARSSVEISINADVNCDGVIDMLDVILLRKYIANYDYDNMRPGIHLGTQN